MRITQSHKILDSILLFLLVFSGGGLVFVLNRNLFSVLLCVVAVFSLFFFGKKITKSNFNSSFFGIVILTFIVLLNYFVSPGSQKFLKYGFHLLNITSCVLIYLHFQNNRTEKYFLQRI